MVISLEEKVQNIISTPSDINEHITTMINYGKKCEHITEMGVRGIVSTWAWLACNPKKLIAYDIQSPSIFGSSIEDVIETAEFHSTHFEFHLSNVLNVEIEETDLLFIDTWHAYNQLKSELKLHASKVRKFICLHDTTSYEFVDETAYAHFGWKSDGFGIWRAVEEFLEENRDWQVLERFVNNNGFTILGRITPPN